MPVVTVSQLNNYMKRYIDQNSNLSDIWIKGEISNFKQHYSGHIYMTLKDENSSLKSVMFKAYVSSLKFKLFDGLKIIAYGKIGVYEPSGTYQLYIENIIPDGKGELYAAYEQLKLKLASEGLFDEQRKRPIPKFPKTIGIVTSVSGAAVKDILNVISRRCKNVNLIIYPAKVQGIGASESICDGIRFFSSKGNVVDTVIIARGGGSIEDLWAFNEEITARAIYECSVPVISGVGHETDYTISDFVADMRAPTPSAAAELATPSDEKIINDLKSIRNRLGFYIDNKYSLLKTTTDKYDVERIYRAWKELYSIYYQKSEKLTQSISNLFDLKYMTLLNKLTRLNTSLENLNPLNILKRGYTFVEDDNEMIVDFRKIKSGDDINIRFYDGKLECSVRKVIYDEDSK